MPESAQESQNSSDFGGRGRGVREVTSIQSQARPNLRPHPNVDSAAQCLSSPPTLPDRDLNSLIAEKVAALRTEGGSRNDPRRHRRRLLRGRSRLAHHPVQQRGGAAFPPRAARRCSAACCGRRCPARATPRSASCSSRPWRAARRSGRKPSRSSSAGRWMAYRLFPLGDGMGVVFRDITDRKRAEEQRDLLIKELEHRVKNTLTIVQSIAAQTFRSSGVDPAVQRAFEARLIALEQRAWRADAAAAGTAPTCTTSCRRRCARTARRTRALHRRRARRCASARKARSRCRWRCTSLHQRDQVRRALQRGRPCRCRLERRGRTLPLAMARARRPAGHAPTRTGFGSRMIERALALQLSGQGDDRLRGRRRRVHHRRAARGDPGGRRGRGAVNLVSCRVRT